MKPFVFCLAAASLFGLAIPPGNAQTAGRLLASNCFQCHATNGKGGFDRLAGKPAAEIFEEMKELQGDPATAEREEEIMVVHANGYTDAEIRLIAKFFASQK